jgi:hypothetical protein
MVLYLVEVLLEQETGFPKFRRKSWVCLALEKLALLVF